MCTTSTKKTTPLRRDKNDHVHKHKHKHKLHDSIMNIIIIILLLLLVSVVLGDTSSSPDGENSEYFFACSGGEFETVKALIEKDPTLANKITSDGEHCLHLCALSGNADIVKLLLDVGADPDIRSNWEQGLRMHPLAWSTFYGRHDIIELLLEAGADVNADFDLGTSDESGNVQKATVLDVVEQILLNGLDGSEDKERFIKTRNVLVKNGAMRYVSIEPEL